MSFVYCSVCREATKENLDFCGRCGTVLIALSDGGALLPYTVLRDRYKISALLKTGGMGRVYKGEDCSLNSVCAVKELILDSFDEEDDKEHIINLFKSEAQILAQLRHPNLPYVIDYFTFNERTYLVMDYIKGENLEIILEEDDYRGLDIEKILDWALQICDVLEYLHKQEPPILFRDLKPSNLMIKENDGRVVLIDFGLAERLMKIGHKQPKSKLGTAGYAPPEQYEGIYDPRSDIYSLGATLHHLITGIAPMVPFKFQSIKKLKPELPARLDNIIGKLVSKNIDRRYQSIREVRKDFEELMEKIKYSRTSLVTKIKDGTSRLKKKLQDSIGIGLEIDGEDETEKIEVFLVDDEEHIRGLLRKLITFSKDMELSGEATNGLEAIEKLAKMETFPDVILMDIMMPELDGITATKKLLKNYPQAKIVMLTVMGDKASVIDSFRAGAKGYLVKYKVDEVIAGIRNAAKGETPIESSVAGFLLQELGR